MTAEIAIINKSAVTLATDSAVTLTVRGAEKIYNSADKLFELCDKDAIGIMIYHNLEYMGVLLEVAIKQFRGNKNQFKNVADAAEAFFKYLLEDLLPDEALQKQHARTILHSDFLELRKQFERVMSRTVEESRDPRKINFPGLFTNTVKARLAALEVLSPAECFVETAEQDIETFYAESIEAVIDDVFRDLPLEADQKGLLRRFGVLLLHRDELSDSFTGLVFAGFGSDETFPSLIAYKTDGVIFGRLKKRQTDRVTANRSEVMGRILPFAQREMVDRFLYGIDPDFEEVIERYLEAAVASTGEAIAEALPAQKSRTTKEKLEKSVSSATEAAVKTWREKMIPHLKGRFVREVQDMIFLMPKQELAALAQELINLTSVKRKFSSGRESVGGPIDVAVISKVDGFVWVRRKHYFEQNLNPRYFSRKFGANRGSGGVL